MDTFVLPLLMGAAEGAAGAAGTAQGSSSFLMQLAPFAIIIAIFYFLIIRPQNKKRKETEKMLSALKKGDKIVTVGGLYGTIQSVKESTVIVKVDDNVKLEFSRSSISSVITAAKEEKEKSESEGQESSESGE